MLRSVKDLEKCAIQATDGTIGHVSDLFFDDLAWVIRYLVVDTGTWLSGRKVLIAPFGTGRPDWTDHTISVKISKEQVRASPDIDTHKPLSAQREANGLGCFWYSERPGAAESRGTAGHLDGAVAGVSRQAEVQDFVRALPPESSAWRARAAGVQDDAHLRSCNDVVVNYLVRATDGDIGHVCGFLIDEDSWAIRYLVVNTGSWWLGHKVVLAPEWIDEISWSASTLSVDTTRQAVQDAPPYDSVAEVNRRLEIVIYRHYDRMGYWMSDVDPEVSP